MSVPYIVLSFLSLVCLCLYSVTEIIHRCCCNFVDTDFLIFYCFIFRLICAVVVLMVVCGGIQLSCGEELKCEFKTETYAVGTLYSCKVTTLNNENNNKTITGSNGVHLTNKNDNDVKAIFIHNTNNKFISTNLGSLFNLKALHMERTQLIEIKSNDFQGMQDLEHLNLWENQLTELSSDVFSTLPKLRFIDLSFNKIKYIASDTFDNLNKLNDVYLESNICLNKNYNGASTITQLKQDIQSNCKNPNPVTTTTTTTTTQNSMELQRN